ncbi:MAG TPA: PilZ domain-containing protein [Candidatus Sulfotelmatobacter sp.]|nr:PilZ domain-containing protein [Candidatus Sulfotelmatobacter sp.]
MPYLPQPRATRRAPRTSFAETTPVVLRCKDGRRVPGKLQVISLSGGLLCLPQPLDQGSQVKVMFLTRKGSVLGAAEMLSPISWGTQPFKFVKLYDDDERRLDAAIQLSVEQNRLQRVQMDNPRAW